MKRLYVVFFHLLSRDNVRDKLRISVVHVLTRQCKVSI
jgi:hypothetical protein